MYPEGLLRMALATGCGWTGGDELGPQKAPASRGQKLPSERLAFGSGAGGADDWLSLATVVWGSLSLSHGISAGLVYPSVLVCLVSELP